MLFHGNYRVYKARQVREAIDECGFVEMEHPPYTPDLAPSEYYLFSKLKKDLRRCRFR
jgi:histone-lysine N-methyltransferase SETMAR